MSQTSNAIQSLEVVRERVKQRLASVAEYRAFLAIDKPMAEVANIPDLVTALEAAKQKILERLKLTREYQAMLTVEKAIKEISEVLEVVGDDGSFEVASGVLTPSAKASTAGANEGEVVGLSLLVHESLSTRLGSEEEKAKVA